MYGERTAQIWGARAVAKYVHDHPTLTRAEILQMGRYSQVASSGSASDKENDLNRLYLGDPEVQRRLQCAPAANQACMSRFNPGAGGSTRNAVPTTSGANSTR